MRGSLLLTSSDQTDEEVYEGRDTRPLRKSGGAFVSSYSKDILRQLGIVKGNQLVEQLDVDQYYQIFLDRGELVVTHRIPIKDASELRKNIVEPEIAPEPAD